MKKKAKNDSPLISRSGFLKVAVVVATAAGFAGQGNLKAAAKSEGSIWTVSPSNTATEINQAIADAQAAGKGTVFFTAGNYNLGTDRLEVVGSGDVTLTADAPTDHLTPSTYPVTITGNPSGIISTYSRRKEFLIAPLLLVSCGDEISKVTIKNLSIDSEGFGVAHFGNDLGTSTTNPGIPQKGGNLIVEFCSLKAGRSNESRQNNFAFISLLVGAVSLRFEKCLAETIGRGKVLSSSHEAVNAYDSLMTSLEVNECTIKADGGGAFSTWDGVSTSGTIAITDNILTAGDDWNASLFCYAWDGTKSCILGGNKGNGHFRLGVPGMVVKDNKVYSNRHVHMGVLFLVFRGPDTLATHNTITDARSVTSDVRCAVQMIDSNGVTFTHNEVKVNNTGAGREFSFGAAVVVRGNDSANFSNNLITSEGYPQTKAVIRTVLEWRTTTNSQFIQNEFRGEFDAVILAEDGANNAMEGSSIIANKMDDLTLASGGSGAHIVLSNLAPKVGGKSNKIIGSGIEIVDDLTDSVPNDGVYDGRNTIVHVRELKSDPNAPLPGSGHGQPQENVEGEAL